MCPRCVLRCRMQLVLAELFTKKLYPCDNFSSAGDCSGVAIFEVPSGFHLQEIRYQKYFLRFGRPPVLNSFLSKSCAIFSMCAVNLTSARVEFVAGLSEVAMRDVSSTYASPIRSIVWLPGVSIRKQVNLVAMDHSIGSRAAIHMEGEAQLPWPVPKMRRSAFVW